MADERLDTTAEDRESFRRRNSAGQQGSNEAQAQRPKVLEALTPYECLIVS